MGAFYDKMTSLANIIRSKTGVSGKLTIDNMVTEISNIEVVPPKENCTLTFTWTIPTADYISLVYTYWSDGVLRKSVYYTDEDSGTTTVNVAKGVAVCIQSSNKTKAETHTVTDNIYAPPSSLGYLYGTSRLLIVNDTGTLEYIIG